jgi:endonuclease/exonuclease/phosphatase family metal-dependent hydrolase
MKILTYNIRNWQNNDGESNVEQVLAVLRETGADIIGLNEVLHPYPSPGADLPALDFLARELEMQAVFGPSFQPQDAFHLPEVMSGNALLSRWPILAAAAHHLTPVVNNQRGLLETRVLLPDQSPLTLYVTHLEPKREDVRAEQVRSVLSWTVRDRDKPHVLMGDLNTYNPADYTNESSLADFRAKAEARGFTFFEPQVIPHLLKTGYVDACAAHPQPTWDTEDELWARMDFVLLSEPLAPHLTACHTWDTDFSRGTSDHLPVLIELDRG